MYRCLVLAAACLIALLVVPQNAVRAGVIYFNLQGKAGFGLLPGNENHTPTGGPGSGGEIGAGIFLDDATNVLTINAGWGSANGFTNLTGNATAAHIHGPKESGGVGSFTQNAGVKYDIGGTTAGFSNSASAGGWTNTQVSLTAQDVADLLAGRFYLNVHTTTNGGGEIRGNLVGVPEPSSLGLLMIFGLPVLVARKRAGSAL